MKRLIYPKLLAWKADNARKPLILRGARQVGKTHILKVFGESEYENTIYLNFEKNPALASLFDSDLDPSNILKNLTTYFETIIHPGTSLIILDEIQACPAALNSLKYFHEEANEYHIAAAGSLLGVKLAKNAGFPVGQVNFMDLYPMTFDEFLDALGKSQLRSLISEITITESIAKPIHQQLIDLLKLYYVIGGMPEAVATYHKIEDLQKVREIQQAILDSYTLDFVKHAPNNQTMKISQVWESIPKHLAKENKKFMFSAVRPSARAREYEEALQWLVDAGLIHKSYRVSRVRQPLKAHYDTNVFKIYALDTGLLGALCELSPKIILEGDTLFTEYKGALTENYVAQVLATLFSKLYYWSSQGNSEVDFIVAYESEIYPLEVKANTSTRNKSLKNYIEKYQPKQAGRTGLLNLFVDEGITNYPLYLIHRFLKIE